MEMALCYEVHGLQGRYFNLVSEPCLSVNAHYMLQDPDKPLHFIDEIAVVATNAEGTNIEMKIDRHCNLLVDDDSLTNTVFLNSSGVLVEAIRAFNDVVIVATDCGRDDRETVLWIRCVPHEHGFMQLDISRDLGLGNSSSHGLLGELMLQLVFF